jgi:hypothetical protein
LEVIPEIHAFSKLPIQVQGEMEEEEEGKLAMTTRDNRVQLD